MIKLKRHNFHYDLFEKRSVPINYQNIKGIPIEFYEPSYASQVDDHVTIINCVPPYLEISNKNINSKFANISRSYRLGFAMNLSESKSAIEFLKIQLGKKGYKNLRQDRQRLERDHEINYKVFHGEIDESICNELMNQLESFIRFRFKDRTEKHTALSKWSFYKETTYDQIIHKNASLFVIYQGNNPIAITLTYHYNKILNAAVASFDYNFYKYSLGKIMFVNQIEWCYDNNYELIDIGWGSLDYKIKFSNAVFKYQTHVLYPKNNVFKYITSALISWFLMFKYYLDMIRAGKYRLPNKKYKNKWMTSIEF